MTRKHMNMALLLVILAIGAGYLFYAQLIAEKRLGENLGPILFPVTIGVGIVALAAVEIVRSLRPPKTPEDAEQEAAPFDLPNAGKLAATVGLIAAHIFIWQNFGLFYPSTFGLFVALVLVFRATLAPREIGLAVLWAGTFTLVLYLVFQRAFGIALG